jgi:predicted amidohydrolase YtcJ
MPGRLIIAGLVLPDRDILTIDPDHIVDVRVDRT